MLEHEQYTPGPARAAQVRKNGVPSPEGFVLLNKKWNLAPILSFTCRWRMLTETFWNH